MRIQTGNRIIAISFVKYVSLFLGFALFWLVASPSVHGLTSISQAFATNEDIPIGGIVSLKNNEKDIVVAATTKDADSLIGVVINSSNSLLNVLGDRTNEIQVTSSGIVDVLASTINGDIKQGDHITSSPIKGVGMKATENIRVVGIAQGDLKEGGGSQQNYTDAEGNQQTVTLGQIPVLVNVSYYFKQPEKTIIPSALQNLANSLAGKEVSTLPIVLSSGVFLIMIIVVVSIIYSMIRSSIISVGRNPLSQSAVYRDVIQLSALVIAILAVGLIAIYLILTRL